MDTHGIEWDDFIICPLVMIHKAIENGKFVDDLASKHGDVQ